MNQTRKEHLKELAIKVKKSETTIFRLASDILCEESYIVSRFDGRLEYLISIRKEITKNKFIDNLVNLYEDRQQEKEELDNFIKTEVYPLLS